MGVKSCGKVRGVAGVIAIWLALALEDVDKRLGALISTHGAIGEPGFSEWKRNEFVPSKIVDRRSCVGSGGQMSQILRRRPAGIICGGSWLVTPMFAVRIYRLSATTVGTFGAS